MNLQEILAEYDLLPIMCGFCDHCTVFYPPLDLTTMECAKCAKILDPMTRIQGKPVNHLLMCRLVSTCYLHQAFARNLIRHYRADLHRSRMEEFGLDRRLLVAHAANALIEQQANPVYLIIALLAAALFSLKYGTIVLFFASLSMFSYLAYKKFGYGFRNNSIITPISYNPSCIPRNNFRKIETIISRSDAFIDGDLFLFSGTNPFSMFGQRINAWNISIPCDSVNAKNGKTFDIDKFYQFLDDNLVHNHEIFESRSRYWVENVTLLDGRSIRPFDAIFLDSALKPRRSIPPSRLRDLPGENSARVKVFRRYSYYDPYNDYLISTFLCFDILQFGFTLQSVTTRLLPMTDKLQGRYNYRPDVLSEHGYNSPLFNTAFLAQIRFVLIHLMILTFALFAVRNYSIIDNLNQQAIAALSASKWLGWIEYIGVLVRATHASLYLHIIPYLYVFLIICVSCRAPDSGRLSVASLRAHRAKAQAKLHKLAMTFDYAPQTLSLRLSQSRRSMVNSFEESKLMAMVTGLERRIQDCAMVYLQDLGIDVQDEKEKLTLINNFGVLNNGTIRGHVNNKSRFRRMGRSMQGFAAIMLTAMSARSRIAKLIRKE